MRTINASEAGFNHFCGLMYLYVSRDTAENQDRHTFSAIAYTVDCVWDAIKSGMTLDRKFEQCLPKLLNKKRT